MMVLGMYACEIPHIGWRAIGHSITNRIISMTMLPGTLLNIMVIHVALVHYFITLICLSIFGTFSADAVVLRVDLPRIITIIFSNYLSIYKFSTNIPRLW